MTAEIGQPAPDFELPSTTGDRVSLSSFRGRTPVAVVFIPFAFTGVCEGELCAIRDDFSPFESAGTQVVVITCDPAPSQKVWADQQGFTFPLLSDFWPHGEVARAYGAFNEERGCANRVTVLVGIDGDVVDRFETENLATPRSMTRYADALRQL